MTDGVRTLTEAEAMNRESERRKARARAERRERIAAQVLAGMYADPSVQDVMVGELVRDAMNAAECLMAALDKAEARDREATP